MAKVSIWLKAVEKTAKSEATAKDEAKEKIPMFSRFAFLFALLILFSLFGFVFQSSGREAVIKIDGSSTVYPITEAVSEEFQKANTGVKITVGVSGTGGGFKKFCRGETDISNASRPIKKSEMELCKGNGVEYIELPVAFDAMAVVVNKKNNWVNKLGVDELKKIWEPEAQGKISRWSDVRNNWPKEPLRLFGPGTDSGTFDYFTEVIIGESGKSRGDYIASEDDNVLVQGVVGDKYSLGYFGLAYYLENKDKLKAVPIVNPKTGEAVYPSLENVINGKYVPLSRPLFIYVSLKSYEDEMVRKFVEFYITQAKKLSKEVGYIPLPDKAYELALERFRKKVTGTVFGGEIKLMSIEDILKAETVK